MKRFVIIYTAIILLTSCGFSGLPSIENAKFIDSNTIEITIWEGVTSDVYSTDIVIIVNDEDYSYYITKMNGESIVIGSSKTTHYRCKLNKQVFPGDVMRIRGNGIDVTGDISITYE